MSSRLPPLLRFLVDGVVANGGRLVGGLTKIELVQDPEGPLRHCHNTCYRLLQHLDFSCPSDLYVLFLMPHLADSLSSLSFRW